MLGMSLAAHGPGMNMKILMSLLLMVALGAVPAADAASFNYGYTDTQLHGTSQIDYNLALKGGGCPPDCTMAVTITVSGTPNPNTTPVYLGTLIFKFGGSTLLDLDGVGVETLPTAIPSGWGVIKDADVNNTSTADLHHNGNGAVPNGGFVGFYNTNFTANLINLSAPGTFTFLFDAHGVNTNDNTSLHNEYYTLNGSTVNFQTFLSVSASPSAAPPQLVTPEPSTGSMALIFSALIGVGVCVRKWRKQ